jgi:Uma2 family endonuclease
MATVMEEPKRVKPVPASVVCGGLSFTVADETRQINLPSWVVDLDSFCEWVESDDVPEKLRVWYLKGEVWIDMSQEQVNTHVLLKTSIFIVLGGLVNAARLGRFYADGLFLRNKGADIGGNPDATFASTATLLAKRLRPVPGKKGGIVALEGSPDMVLEVVSTSSVHKDTVILKRAYWEAGAREYWLVDARKEPLTFDIFRHTPKGYTATRKQEGWIKSAVFGKSFRLTQQVDPALGDVVFNLEVR